MQFYSPTSPLINHRLSLGQAEELPSFVVAGSSVAVTARHHPADVSQKFAA